MIETLLFIIAHLFFDGIVITISVLLFFVIFLEMSREAHENRFHPIVTLVIFAIAYFLLFNTVYFLQIKDLILWHSKH